MSSNISYNLTKVLSNVEISSGIFKMQISGSFEVKPGQFFMLNGWEHQALLPRPISIQDADHSGIYFLYQAKGKGTELLSRLKQGDKIHVMGPLGNGFDVEKLKGRIAVVSGGIGVAPMNYLVKSLKGCTVDLYCGFRYESLGIEGMNLKVNEIHIATEDGSEGYKGFITDIFTPEHYDVVICCGPEAMMNKVAASCKKAGVQVYISTEKFMACGLGVCLVCTCKTINGNKRSCTEGPVFLGEELILNA